MYAPTKKVFHIDTYKPVETKKMTAIIFCDPKKAFGKCALKYHNIPDQPAPLLRFENFARKFPGAMYINYYCKSTRAYLRRKYLNQP